MLRKRRPTNAKASGSNSNPTRSKWKKTTNDVKILLNISKELSDWLPPFKPALDGVAALIKRYEQFEDVRDKTEDLISLLAKLERGVTATAVDVDGGEDRRRSDLSSTLEEIEKRSQVLLEKGVPARFMDKEDSKEVAKLVERLREAIALYQLSQQQAIYDQITDLTSSFGALLKLHISPRVKNKLEHIMAWLDRLRSEENREDVIWCENEHRRKAQLFGALRLIRENGSVLFNRISVQGYEECKSDILTVSGMAEDIRDALLEYQTTQQRTIYDQGCKLIDAADLSVLNGCRRARRAEYRHDSRRGCLRGTRETVLEEIELWTKDFKRSPVFWLNGLAGTGKSTIAQTVSECAFAEGFLGASFFCSRDFEDRSDLHSIFPSLAFQLAHKYPHFRSHLVSLLRSDPDVVDESLYGQMKKLIVEPLQSATIPTVIVIDALDECKDEEPSSAILSVLGRLIKQIPKVKFFITGRPEPRIDTGFRLPLLVDATKIFVLHDVQPSLINNDIRLFLKHELSELAQRHRLGGWPSDEHIDVLCHRAAGLFVYAAATVKFLDSSTHLPKRRLDVILGLPDCTDPVGKTQFKPKTTLDSLYVSILQTAFSGEDADVDSKVRSIIGAVVLLVNPLPPLGIAELIGLDVEEVILFLRLVQSLLALNEGFNNPVKPFHKSFPDFITNPSRCTDARFCISPRDSHLELATNCLRLMNNGLEQNLLSLPDYALNAEVKDLQTRIDDHISVALRYACKSWHNHLTRTVGDVADVISDLRLFLEEKFLAWLEVVSVLGAMKEAVRALEQLVSWSQEVAKDEQLLNTAKDCSYFVTNFFEPINVSATHVYHSALELSPLSSIVRKLHYHRRPNPFPRVILGTPDSWDPSVAISNSRHSPIHSVTGSPCGQFVAIQTRESVEIRDALTSGLFSTLQPTEPTSELTSGPTYSPDGRSIACVAGAMIIIWDIQTGGVVKEIQRHEADTDSVSLVWSLGGWAIGTVSWGWFTWAMRVYDVVLGTGPSHIKLRLDERPYLWAHGESFRVATKRIEDGVFFIDILEAWPAITRIESFRIESLGPNDRIKSFSPTTYRASVEFPDERIVVLDIRSSERLLETELRSRSHCFSSDGSFFAAFSKYYIDIRKYTAGHYTPWREFQTQDQFNDYLQFSPTWSSILVCYERILRVWRLDIPYTSPSPHGLQCVAYSSLGVYVAAAKFNSSTVVITNLLSPTPSQLIDTGLEIWDLVLTGNILLVLDGESTTAWLLTEEGTVNGVPRDGRAGPDDSIWTVSIGSGLSSGTSPIFFADGQIEAIKDRSKSGIIHVYHTRTGEIIDSYFRYSYDTRDWRDPSEARGWSHLLHRDLDERSNHPEDNWPVSKSTVQRGWVNDPAGKHRLWVPVEWRTLWSDRWYHDITTLQLEIFTTRSIIIIKF